jgi:hypothetical protein
MKRFLGLVSLLLFINACDDGNMTVETIDFATVTAVKCPNKEVIYKVKNTEILFLEIPPTDFVNDETLIDTPIVIPISSSKRVVYRLYNGEASAENVCPPVPIATPNVLEEWITTSGTIEITTTAVKTTDPITLATKITKYNHNIVLKNVTFQKPSGPQIYTTFSFGNYNTTATNLPFGFNVDAAAKSTCDNRVFNISGGEAFILDVDNFGSLFANEETTMPRTATISATKKVTYELYNATVNNLYFCTTSTPATPVLLQEWNAIDGMEGVDGTIEVTTTSNGPNTYRHTIHLKKVTLKRGNSDFYLGDDYIFGSFDTTL